MEKKIEDYLYLYYKSEISCEGTGGYKLISFDDKEAEVFHEHYGFEGYELSEIKLVLRPLSDMTLEESKEYNDKMSWCIEQNDESLARESAEETRYLLSRSFDLFELIKSGLAIDKTLIR
jgi:hypothetical protein